MAALAELHQLEEVILSKIQQRIHSRTTEETSIAKALKYYDLQNAGYLNFEQFKRSLAPYTAGVSDQDLKNIFGRYADQGMLHIRQFAMEFSNGARRLEPTEDVGDFQPAQAEDSEETLARIKDFLFDRGPRGITSLSAAFRDADPQNLRVMHFETFMMVMADFFQESGCELLDSQLDGLFQLFQQPHAPDQMAYDEFFLALKEEPSQARRASIRQAFRRLDKGSEGLVDMQVIIRSFNKNRHPEVSGGTRQADEVLAEFAETLKDHIDYRRGQRSYPTNLVAWEEFEDYYKSVSGCYLTDEEFCNTLEKVWDLNKLPDSSVESREALARPAAGAPAKSRAGLHHWQTNTLPISPTHHKVEQCTQHEDVLLRARTQIARKGLRAAIDIVQNFYAADDDVDDELDVYEFRQACQKSGLAFRHAEEVSIFEACGSASGGKIAVPRFLQLLHGELNPQRMSVVDRAFAAVGGTPGDPTSTVTPATLKDHFAAQAHPLVLRGQLEPGYVLAEFLDTFSQLAHVVGGCENGLVSYTDFVAYYEVMSSTIDNDTLFDLILQRVWNVPAKAPQDGPKEAWGDAPVSPRRTVVDTEHPPSPMASRKPPTFDGPSAYARPIRQDQEPPSSESAMHSHRRFGRSDGPPTVSPITKSSIVFNEKGNDALGQVIDKLRSSIALRGLRGWMGIVQRFQHYDYRRNGTVMRLDWQRLHKSLGLGLSSEEQDLLFKAMSQIKKGAAMDYVECLRMLRGELPQDRAVEVERLFQAINGGAPIPSGLLKSCFQASSAPNHLLRKKDASSAGQEFNEVVDFFSQGADFDVDKFEEFFAMVSAVHEDDDEFRLMTTSAFGIN